MSSRCRNCGRGYRSSHGRRHYRRHRRTVFSEGRFWMWMVLAVAVLWVLSDLGVIGS